MPSFVARPSAGRRVLLAALVGAAALGGATQADAAITLQKQAPQQVLYGTTSGVTLHLANAQGQPDAYNASVRDVLPPGVTFVPGSARIAGQPVAPTVIANQPGVGSTTLVFDNLTDLSPGSAADVTYAVAHGAPLPGAGGTLGVGDSYTNTASAFASLQPRIVPRFDAAGRPAGNDPVAIMATASMNATTQVSALQIRKSEPSPEHELLRGAHDHQTAYTLTVRNNDVHATTGITVDDYLPAGLEFLGCGQVDRTTSAGTNLGSAQEYDGAGTLAGRRAAPADCVTPQVVETVRTDPDGAGPRPFAVYTHVRWAGLGDLAPGQEREISYLAAVPIRENTLAWSTPTATSGAAAPAMTGAQAANLNNNSGAETADEQALTNLAVASGVYRGDQADPALRQAVQDTTTQTVTAEDVAVRKSVDTTEIAQNGISRWSLQFRTSEYRTARNIVVEDVLPDGLCPLGATDHEDARDRSGECAPTGARPSLEYASVVERPTGEYELGWQLPDMGRSATATVTFPTRTRSRYQEDYVAATPVLAGDAWTNTVSLTADDFRTCLPGGTACAPGGTRIPGDEPDGTPDVDASAASQSSGGVSIDKTVLGTPGSDAVPTPTSCATRSPYGDALARYAPGDRVCWKLRVDFASLVDSGSPIVRDFVPPGFVYEAGSAQVTAANTVADVPAPTVEGSALTWNLTDVPTGGRVFEVVIATRVEKAVADVAGQITGNLMKLSFRNTNGQTFPRRDRVEVERVDAALTLNKGVTAVSGSTNRTFTTPSKDVTIAGGDTVTYAVDVANSGIRDALDVEVRDLLPTGVRCSDLVPGGITLGGACADGAVGARSTIRWTGLDVAAGTSTRLSYVLHVPTRFEPGHAFVNDAGVVAYQGTTNAGTTFEYVPQSNIDPSREASANAAPARSTATVRTKAATIAKRQATSVTSGGNNAATQVTIGERIDYTVDVTVPVGTTLHTAPRVRDTLNGRVRLVGTPAVQQLGGTPASPTVSVDGTPATTEVVRLDFAGSYTNVAPADAVFRLTFSVTVDDDPTTARTSGGTPPTANTITNSATLAYLREAGSAVSTTSNTTTANVVEPLLGLTKTAPGKATGTTLSPGETFEYLLQATNTGTGVSTGFDTVLVDTLPTDLIPLRPDGTPAADGQTVGTDGQPGTWDAAARTITWDLGDVAPAATPARRFAVTVKSPPAAGATIKNAARVVTSSLDGTVAGERTSASTRTTGYRSDAERTLPILGGTLTKTVDRATATIGDPLEYTLEYRIPANLRVNDLVVLDTLPDGVAYDARTAPQLSCVSGCPTDSETVPEIAAAPGDGPPVAAFGLGPVVPLPALVPTGGSVLGPQVDATTGTSRLAFVFGDLADSSEERVVRVVFRAYVRDAFVAPANGAMGAGKLLRNGASAHYNDDARNGATPTTVPLPGDYTGSSSTVTADTTVTEPRLTVDKTVSGDGDADDRRDTAPGDDYTYAVKVTNTGTADAYDVDVADALAPLLRGAALVGETPDGQTRAITEDGLEWRIDHLAAGQSVVLEYTAKLAPSAELTQAATVVNTAKVPSYWGAPQSVRDVNDGTIGYRHHTETPQDVVTLDVRLPDVRVEKTTGGTGFPESADAQVGEPLTWRIVVRNPSPSSAARHVRVRDVLPAGWSYQADSAAFAPALAADTATEPVVTKSATGDALVWADIGEIAPGAQRVLTLRAVPGLDARAGENPQRNSVTVTAQDAGDATAAKAGSYTAQDTGDAQLRLPSLEVTKTPDGGATTAGTAATYTVRVRNTSTTAPAREVVVTDVLGKHQRYAAGTATATPATGFAESGVVRDADADTTTTTWRIAAIPAGGSVDVTVPVTVAAGAPAGTAVRNGVSVVSREVTTPVTDEGTLDPSVRADVGVEKTVVAPTGRATAGGTVTYALKAINHGPSDATGVVVADDLPQALTPVTAEGCAVDGRKLRCTVGGLRAGADRTFTVTAKVGTDVEGTVRNVATVSATSPDPTPGNDTSDADVPVDPLADVAVTKDVDRATVRQGDAVRYAITVENRGVSDAKDVVLTDPVPAGLTVVGTPDGCTVADGTVRCAIGRMTPGAKRTITVDAQAVDVGTVRNVATATTATPQSNEKNDRDDADVRVLPVADLGIEKTAPATATANGDLTYRLAVRNHGPSPATNVRVTDALPAGVTFVSASNGCTVADRTVTCRLGALPVTAAGDPARVVQITVRVPWASAATTLRNTASVAGDEPDRQPANDRATAETVIGPAADLVVDKRAPTLDVPQGVAFDYAITVENRGPSPAKDVGLRDPMPAGVVASRATTDRGTCEVVDGRVRCALGDLADGERATVTVRATGTTPGAPVNVATATSGTPERTPDDNVDDAPVRIIAAADVGVTKTAAAKVEPDGTLDYRLTARNHGPSTATGVVVTDVLPAGLEVVAVPRDCTVSGATITCTVGTLDVGEQRELELRTHVPYTAAGTTITNTASVRITEQDLVAANNTAQATTTVGPGADLAIEKTAGGAVAGGAATWTLLVRNDGPSPATKVTVRDVLPEGTTFRDATPSQGSCRAASRDVVCDLGTLASGGTVQIGIVAAVAAEYAGRTLRNMATVEGTEPDPRPENGTATVDVVVDPAPEVPTPPTGGGDGGGSGRTQGSRTSQGSEVLVPEGAPRLRVTKVASTTAPRLGVAMTYRVRVENTGTARANVVRVVDTMNAVVHLGTIRTTQGRCTVRGTSGLTCDLGGIEAGASATITSTVTPMRGGALRNTATAEAVGQGVVDSAGSGAQQAGSGAQQAGAVADVRVRSARAGLLLAKTTSRRVVRGGGTVTLKLRAKMPRGIAGVDVRVCERLPKGLTYVRVPGATFRGGKACWDIPYMAPGSSRTMTIVARAERGDRVRRLRNVAMATGRNVARRSAWTPLRVLPSAVRADGGVTG